MAEPVGYRFQNFSRPGILVYTVPQQRATFQDAIAFGVMTTQSDNAILLRAFSESIGDFIEIRLVGSELPLYFLFSDNCIGNIRCTISVVRIALVTFVAMLISLFMYEICIVQLTNVPITSYMNLFSFIDFIDLLIIY